MAWHVSSSPIPPPGPPNARTQRLVALAISLLTFAVYVAQTAATPYLLDSAELATAAFGLGIAHPPGEPLALLFTRLVLLIPGGSVALRAGLAQALAGAIAAGMVFWLAHHLLERFDHKLQIAPMGRLQLATAAAFAFAFSPGATDAASRPEVYALATALGLAALLLTITAVRRDDRRFALVAAFLIGLGVTNHPLLAGATGLGSVCLALPMLKAPPRIRFVLAAIAAVVAGLLTNSYLFLRSIAVYRGSDLLTSSSILWGDARDPGGLWWILSGKTFLDKSAIVHTRADPGGLPYLLMDELTIVGAMLALAGLYAAFRRPGCRMLVAAASVTAIGSVCAALFAGLDPGNPDIRGYLGGCLAVLPAIGAIGAGFFVLLLRGQMAQHVLCAILAMAAFSRGPAAVVAGGLRDVRTAELVAGQIVTELPPRAALITGHFETAALVAYHRLVEGRRPDVAWVHLGFARGPGYAERMGRAEPDLAGLLNAYRSSPLGLPDVQNLGEKRPVHLEAFGEFSPALGQRLAPCGASWCVTAAPEEMPGMPAMPEPTVLSSRLPPWLEDFGWQEGKRYREVEHYMAWKLFVDADLACRAERQEAWLYLRALRTRFPQDAMARQLEGTCALGARRGFNLLEYGGRRARPGS